MSTAHHRCQAQSVAQDTEQKHGKHRVPLLEIIWHVILCDVLECLSISEMKDMEVLSGGRTPLARNVASGRKSWSSSLIARKKK